MAIYKSSLDLKHIKILLISNWGQKDKPPDILITENNKGKGILSYYPSVNILIILIISHL